MLLSITLFTTVLVTYRNCCSVCIICPIWAYKIHKTLYKGQCRFTSDRLRTFTNWISSQNDLTTEPAVMETEGKELVSVGCSGALSSGAEKLAKLLSNQLLVQPSSAAVHCDWLFGWQPCQQPGRGDALRCVNWTMTRRSTFDFSDCADEWCFHITDDDERL